MNCPACITKANVAKMPWESDYIHHIGNHEAEFTKKHKAAIRSRVRNQAMRDLGMVRTPYGWE